MKPIVIAFGGPLGSGKTTAAKHLESLGAVRMPFAKPVKEVAKVLYELTEEQVNGTQEDKAKIDKRYGKSPRDLMLRIGHRLRELVDDDIWIDNCLKKIRIHHRHISAGVDLPTTDKSVYLDKDEGIDLSRPQIYVIDDLRYVNEAATLWNSEEFFCKNVRLEMLDAPRASHPYKDHPSETGIPLNMYHFHVYHSKVMGVEQLKQSIDYVLGLTLNEYRCRFG